MHPPESEWVVGKARKTVKTGYGSRRRMGKSFCSWPHRIEAASFSFRHTVAPREDSIVMTLPVDSKFIRRAVEACDLAALRAALLQASGDAELELLGPVSGLEPGDRARLIERSVHLLETELDGYTRRVPSDDELRRLMDLVLGGPTEEAHFEIRKKFLAFEPFSFLHERAAGSSPIPEDFEVAIIGAGLSGIAAAVQLERLGIPYVVYERREEVGGTWSANKYPDVRVDTLSITYEYSFDDHYPWPQYFANGAEVRDYIEFMARKYGVFDHVRVGHALEQADFDEGTSTWQLDLARSDGSRVRRRVRAIISAAGLFSTPKVPDIPGAESFQGALLHPTEWTDDIDVKGKRVAVVGNGSTGVQLLGSVAAEADCVHVLQRTPQWISPRMNYGRAVEPEVQWLLDHVPGYWNWCRYTSIIGLFTWHEDFLIPDPEWERKGGHITQKSEELRDFLIGYIKEEVGGRQDLIDRLIPDHAPMVRRPVVDNGWYRALTRENVELVTDEIVRFTPTGIETADGKHREVDLVIFATGYKIDQYLWPTEYHGEDGLNLRAQWDADSPRAYLGMMVPRFPNLFIMYGPNSQPVSGGVSLPSWMQIWSAYIGQCLLTLIDEGFSRVAVNEEAFREHNARLDEEASGLAFITDKGSVAKNYYVDAAGRLLVNTPFETRDLYPMMARPDRAEVEFS